MCLSTTCASLAISEGANMKVVQRLPGHKTAVLTLDRYGHLFPRRRNLLRAAWALGNVKAVATEKTSL